MCWSLHMANKPATTINCECWILKKGGPSSLWSLWPVGRTKSQVQASSHQHFDGESTKRVIRSCRFRVLSTFVREFRVWNFQYFGKTTSGATFLRKSRRENGADQLRYRFESRRVFVLRCVRMQVDLRIFSLIGRFDFLGELSRLRDQGCAYTFPIGCGFDRQVSYFEVAVTMSTKQVVTGIHVDHKIHKSDDSVLFHPFFGELFEETQFTRFGFDLKNKIFDGWPPTSLMWYWLCKIKRLLVFCWCSHPKLHYCWYLQHK